MIRTPTVFVLGAGASQPFAFPTGRELVDHTVQALQSNENRAFFTQLGFAEEDVIRFRDQLWGSGRNSVDAFLEHREEFVDVGKAVIAWALYEANDSRMIA